MLNFIFYIDIGCHPNIYILDVIGEGIACAYRPVSESVRSIV